MSKKKPSKAKKPYPMVVPPVPAPQSDSQRILDIARLLRQLADELMRTSSRF